MRILVVEDEHKIARALKRGLEQETFAVDLACDGDEALGLATSEPYDLLILDLMLPGTVDGIGICETVRREGLHTPILMLTAKDAVADRVRGLDAGADDYLVKPFAFAELLARSRALLRRPKEESGTILRVGDLTLDTRTYEVKRGNTTIQLSSREYALLEYLLRNPGRVLTKDNIIAHVWDYDADVLPNSVEVYIGYLRTKIERPFGGSRLIQTIRGFGYKLAETD